MERVGVRVYPIQLESCMCAGLQVWSSSQSPESVMKSVAAVLGLPQSRCTVRCRRMGGAFGGKTTRSVVPATAVAVAANKLGRQVCCTANAALDGCPGVGQHPSCGSRWIVPRQCETLFA